MKRRAMVFLCAVVTLFAGAAQAQDDSSYRALFRIYEDNDFMNIWANGTDRAYSNGTRLDLFYSKKHPSRFFVDRWMPRAGNGSVDVFSWGVMQTMITPDDLSKRIPDKKDFPYSGSLFALHTKHSSNRIRQYNLQTELMMGVMGPPSLARETQEAIHRLIHFARPRGWGYQLPTDLLFNISVAGEKMLAHNARDLELIGGAKVYAGTALNGGALYTLFRFGKMTSYFDGWLSQYTGAPLQWYFFAKPIAEYMATNAMLEGGVFTRAKDGEKVSVADRNRMTGQLEYGVVLAYRNLSASFTQTNSTRVKKHVESPGIGNISVSFAW